MKEDTETAHHSSIVKAATEELQETVVPSVWLWQPTSSSSAICLQAYKISFDANPSDRHYVSFVLLLQSPLPQEAAKFCGILQLRHGRDVSCKLEPIENVFLDHFQVAQAERFQSILFSVLLDRELEHSKINEPPISDGSWYLLLPLKPINSNNEPEIDWTRISKLKPFEDSNYTFGMSAKVDGGALHFSNGVIRIEEVPGLLVKTIHGRYLYCIIEMFTDLKAESSFPNARYSTYANYFKSMYDHDIVLKGQHLVKARFLREAHNFLLTRSREKDHGSKAAPEKFQEAEKSSVEPEKSIVELPPEVCRIEFSGFYDDFVNAAVILPSLLHRLESIVVATQFRNFLSSQFPEGSQVSIKKIQEALTTEKCLDSFSLERLELLGDSFLKYAVGRRLFLEHEEADEGFLSLQRNQRICNSSLFTLGSKIGLAGYIRDTLFDPKHWVAPCHPSKAVCDESKLVDLHGDSSASKEGKASVTCNKRHRWMQRKTVADVVEALIGAYLEDGGEHAALSFMQFIGLEVAIDVSQIVKVQSSSMSNLSLITRIDVEAIEKLLSYSFLYKGLLIEAFTHASFTNHLGKCYQRLEFLGDSVLDFLITNHLYGEFKDSKPGELTDLRSTIVSNESFSRITIHHELYAYLIENSAELRKGIEEFISYIHASSEQELVGDWEGDKCSKVIADILESLSGAVCVDGGFNLSQVWEVLKPLLMPLISSPIVRLHPVRELHEVCQKSHLTWTKSSSPISLHQCEYKYEIHVSTDIIHGTAVSKDKKSAERRAALDALRKLKVLGYAHSCKTPDTQKAKNRDATMPKEQSDKLKMSGTPKNMIPWARLSPTDLNMEYLGTGAGGSTDHIQDCKNFDKEWEFRNVKRLEFGVGPFATLAQDPSETSGVSSTASSSDFLATGAGSNTHYIQDPIAATSEKFEKILGISNVNEPQFSVGMTRAPVIMDHQGQNFTCMDNKGKGLLYENKDQQKGNPSKSSLGTPDTQYSTSIFVAEEEEPGDNSQHFNMSAETTGANIRDETNFDFTESSSSASISPHIIDMTTQAASRGLATASLYETCSQKRWKPPSFTSALEEGPAHDKCFTYNVILELPHVGRVECRGDPRKSSKAAKDSAAAELLAWLSSSGYLLSKGLTS